MASIARRPNGEYRARYRGPDKVERTRQFVRKGDAQAWLDDVTAALVTGRWTAPERGRVTVGEWSARWLDGLHALKPSTRARYANLVRTHVLPTWGRVPLTAVRHADVVAWLVGLSATGLAPATVRGAHRVLSLLLALAVRDDRIARNAAEGVPLPRARRAEPRFLTRAEVERLATAAGRESDVIRFLALTGVRFGEAAALRVRRVDLLRRRLRVAESVTEISGTLVWGTPKSHASRSVPIARSLVEPMAARCVGKGPDDLVFTAPRGGPLRGRAYRRRFDVAARDAGLSDLSPHDLRHTAASLAVAAGGNVKVVQRMLGHASAAMTLDVYAGLFDDDLDALAERLDGPMIHNPADWVRNDLVVVPVDRGSTGR